MVSHQTHVHYKCKVLCNIHERIIIASILQHQWDICIVTHNQEYMQMEQLINPHRIGEYITAIHTVTYNNEHVNDQQHVIFMHYYVSNVKHLIKLIKIRRTHTNKM